MYKFTLSILLAAYLQVVQAQHLPSGEIISTGMAHYDEGKFEEALKNYRMVHENDSNYAFMLAEKALCYLRMGNNDSAIYITEKGLAIPNKYHQHLLRTRGSALFNAGEPEKAIEIYREAIDRYPYSHVLHFNQAVTYLSKEDFPNAVNSLQDALICNPFHASSHMQLGLVMARQGQFTKAFLSLITFLAIEPNSGRSNEILVFVENLASNYLDVSRGDAIEPFSCNELFGETDHLIRSKVVLSGRYKPVIGFDANLVKQIQMIMEMQSFHITDDDFWARLYFPFFKSIKDGNHLVALLNTILVSTGHSTVDKYFSKKGKDLRAFYNTGSYLSWIRANRLTEIDGEAEKFSCDYYDDGSMYSLGNSDIKENEHGPWQYFHANGETMSVGRFISGLKEGEWRYYDEAGLLEMVEQYNNGMLNGVTTIYHPTGRKKLTINYQNGIAEGELKWYDIFGLVNEENTFREDMRNGPGIRYFSSSKVSDSSYFVNNVLEGEYYSYHPGGSPALTSYYADGILTGEYVEYFPDGKVSVKGLFMNGSEEGKWVYYHPNGNLKRIINFEEGLITGQLEDFHYNGHPEAVHSHNEKGMLHGITRFYNNKGQPYLEQEYENDIIIRLTSTDHEGNVLASFGDPSGTFSFSALRYDGSKYSSGSFSKGERSGTWTYYYRNGNLKEVTNYTEGSITGEAVAYHPNGQLRSVLPYMNGILHGHYKSYTVNGIIESDGYFKDGRRDNIWNNYFPDGLLMQSSYFLNDEIQGWKTLFSVDGSGLDIRIRTIGGCLLEHVFYGPDGRPVNHIDFLATDTLLIKGNNDHISFKAIMRGGNYNGTMTWYHPDGSILSTRTMLNDQAEGDYKRYHENGKLKTEGFYLNGKKHKKWTGYYEDGKISYVENNFMGMKDSIRTSYYENGNISAVESYIYDELDGQASYYSDDGKLMVILIYSEGELTGYRYMKGDKLVDPVIITSGDQPVIAFYDDGTKSFEQQFKDFVPDGYQVKYFSDGSIMSKTEFRKGLTDGKSITYYRNGNKKQESEKSGGQNNGEYISYRENGVPEKIITYRNDQEHGPTRYFNPQGKILKVENFHNGIFTGYKDPEI
jgi:uncharacterized protein